MLALVAAACAWSGPCFGGAAMVPNLLLARAQGARTAAESRDVARLFGDHGAMVYGRARRLLGTHADAEEATQEVFIRVITGAESVPPAGEVVPWLCRMTTNYCLNKLRDGSRRRVLLDTRVSPAAGEPAASGPDDLAQARALLSGAEPRQAQAAIYVYIDGMSHDEAAEMLGVSRRTVGNLLDRFTAWARERETGAGAQP